MCIKKEKYFQLKTLFFLFLIPNKWKRTLTLSTSYAMVLDKAPHTNYNFLCSMCVQLGNANNSSMWMCEKLSCCTGSMLQIKEIRWRSVGGCVEKTEYLKRNENLMKFDDWFFSAETYACRNVRCLAIATVRDPIDELEQSCDDVAKREDTSINEFLSKKRKEKQLIIEKKWGEWAPDATWQVTAWRWDVTSAHWSNGFHGT